MKTIMKIITILTVSVALGIAVYAIGQSGTVTSNGPAPSSIESAATVASSLAAAGQANTVAAATTVAETTAGVATTTYATKGPASSQIEQQTRYSGHEGGRSSGSSFDYILAVIIKLAIIIVLVLAIMMLVTKVIDRFKKHRLPDKESKEKMSQEE